MRASRKSMLTASMPQVDALWPGGSGRDQSGRHPARRSEPSHRTPHRLHHQPGRDQALRDRGIRASNAVDDQLGLVERVADPADGRATLLVATDEGRRVFDENRQLRNRGIAALVSGWPDDDRQAFVRLLTRFTDSFESHKARTGPSRS